MRLSESKDLLQGTLDLLVLKTIHTNRCTVGRSPKGFSRSEVLKVQQGSLYPALYRLEHQGWIQSEWGASENKRRAKYYSLMKPGRKQLATETSKWERLSAAVNLVLAEG